MTKIGFLVLFIVVTIGALVFIELAGMPGRDARKRGHQSPGLAGPASRRSWLAGRHGLGALSPNSCRNCQYARG